MYQAPKGSMHYPCVYLIVELDCIMYCITVSNFSPLNTDVFWWSVNSIYLMCFFASSFGSH
jgi:hypothetical protein